MRDREEMRGTRNGDFVGPGLDAPSFGASTRDPQGDCVRSELLRREVASDVTTIGGLIQEQLTLTGAEDAAAYVTTPDLAAAAVEGVQRGRLFLLKWITANDAGVTGSHQAGFHLPQSAWPLFFDRPGEKGELLDRDIVVDWSGYGPTESRAIWYGQGTRSEYRLTRLGRGFPFRGEDHVGSLLVLHPSDDGYRAHVLAHDDEISGFLAGAGLTAGDVGELISGSPPDAGACLEEAVEQALKTHLSFPATRVMAELARSAAGRCLELDAGADPDTALVKWNTVEYRLFRSFEDRDFVDELAGGPVKSVERLIEISLPFVNRRKARAGRSLEYHFGACLEAVGLPYTPQATTEGRNTMDFVFPSEDAYRDPSFPVSRLVACGAKTSAKERWRQVLEEADRVPVKHLLTLQPIALSTLSQMVEKGVHPVVPRARQRQFDRESRRLLMSVSQFIDHAREVTTG